MPMLRMHRLVPGIHKRKRPVQYDSCLTPDGRQVDPQASLWFAPGMTATGTPPTHSGQPRIHSPALMRCAAESPRNAECVGSSCPVPRLQVHQLLCGWHWCSRSGEGRRCDSRDRKVSILPNRRSLDLGARSCPDHIITESADLERAEIGGAAALYWRGTVGTACRASSDTARSARILPDQSVIQRERRWRSHTTVVSR